MLEVLGVYQVVVVELFFQQLDLSPLSLLVAVVPSGGSSGGGSGGPSPGGGSKG